MDHNHHRQSPFVMAEMFGRLSQGACDFFAVRLLDMKGRKVEIPGPAIYSPVHCLFLVTEGEALIEIGGELYFFKPGECATIPAGQIFTVKYFDDCRGYMGGFSADFVGDGHNPLYVYGSLRRWGYHKVFLGDSVARYVEGIFERLYIESESTGNSRIIKSYLATLLTEIEEAADKDAAPGGAPASLDNDACNKFIELVFESHDIKMTVADYASRMNLSRDYLQKLVKRFTGKSPTAWIHEAVILESKSLLSGTSVPIGEVAARVGIEDPSYFSRLFRRSVGVSPLQYRKEHTGNVR